METKFYFLLRRKPSHRPVGMRETQYYKVGTAYYDPRHSPTVDDRWRLYVHLRVCTCVCTCMGVCVSMSTMADTRLRTTVAQATPWDTSPDYPKPFLERFKDHEQEEKLCVTPTAYCRVRGRDRLQSSPTGKEATIQYGRPSSHHRSRTGTVVLGTPATTEVVLG